MFHLHEAWGWWAYQHPLASLLQILSSHIVQPGISAANSQLAYILLLPSRFISNLQYYNLIYLSPMRQFPLQLRLWRPRTSDCTAPGNALTACSSSLATRLTNKTLKSCQWFAMFRGLEVMGIDDDWKLNNFRVLRWKDRERITMHHSCILVYSCFCTHTI